MKLCGFSSISPSRVATLGSASVIAACFLTAGAASDSGLQASARGAVSTENAVRRSSPGRFGQFNVAPTVRPDATGTVLDYVIPQTDSRSFVNSVVYGPDGNEWFSDIGNNFLGKFSGGAITEYPLPPPGLGALQNLISAHGFLWSTDLQELYRIDVNGTSTAVTVPSPGLSPFILRVAVGPEGDVWFTDGGEYRIGHLHPDGTFSFYSTLRQPQKLTFGSDRKPYFIEPGVDPGTSELARIEADGSVRTFSLRGVSPDVLIASQGDVLVIGLERRRMRTAVERFATNGSSAIEPDQFGPFIGALDAVVLPNTKTYVLAARQVNPIGFPSGTLQKLFTTHGPFSQPLGNIVYGLAVGTDLSNDAFVGTRPYDGHAHLTFYRPRR